MITENTHAVSYRFFCFLARQFFLGEDEFSFCTVCWRGRLAFFLSFFFLELFECDECERDVPGTACTCSKLMGTKEKACGVSPISASKPSSRWRLRAACRRSSLVIISEDCSSSKPLAESSSSLSNSLSAFALASSVFESNAMSPGSKSSIADI